MKIFTIIIFFVLSISYLLAEDYSEVDFDWSKVNLPNNSMGNTAIVTEKDELIIKNEKSIFISSDYGKTFVTLDFPFNEYSAIMNYHYDKNNGIILVCKVDHIAGINIYYINNNRNILKNLGFFQIESNYFPINRSTKINDNLLLIGNYKELYLYDIKKNQLSMVNFIDSLITDCKNKWPDDWNNHYSIYTTTYNNSENKIKVIYSDSDNKFYKFSTDYGNTWTDDQFNSECQFNIDLPYAQYNKKDSWYYIFDNCIWSINDKCNSTNKCFTVKFNSGFAWYDMLNLFHFDAVDSCIVFSTIEPENKVLFSKDNGTTYEMIKNYPVDLNNVQFTHTQIYKNGTIVLMYWLEDKSYEIYVGTSKPTSVYSENENNNIVIYPNPARDYIEINGSIGACPNGNEGYPNANEASLIASEYIQIFDMLGVNVFNSKGNPTPTLPEGEGVRIDVSFLPPGVYFIKIGNRVEKFVKM